jgi:Secretory lipase
MTGTTGWCCIGRKTRTGNAVATSGIIAEPPGGFPVISWAHGTVGVADLCAPSRDHPTSQAHPMNVYVHTLLNAFLCEGWAVVMTDYEGLGTTDRRHPHLLGVSEAAGVLDIVRAARRLFGARILPCPRLRRPGSPDQVLSDTAFNRYWPHVDQRCRAGLSQDDSWGGLLGTQQFKGTYPNLPNDDQRRFDAQLDAMNAAVSLTVPARITQAADDQRVRINPPPRSKAPTSWSPN